MSPSRTILISFVPTLLLVLVFGAIALAYGRSEQAQQAWVEHTYQVIEKTRAVIADVGKAESGARGYISMRRENYLEPYRLGAASLTSDLTALRLLTADNTVQAARAAQLARTAAERMQLLARAVALPGDSQNASAIAALNEAGEPLMADINRVFAAMLAEENTLLANRKAATQDSEGNLIFAALVAMLIALVAIIASAGLVLRAQNQTAQSGRQLTLLVQNVKDYALYMLDPQGRVSIWNSGAEKIKGYSAEEIIGQDFSRFYTEGDRAARLPQIALERAVREGRFETEGWRLRKDGSRLWAHVIIDPILDESGRLVGFAKITRDLTERREAEQKLETARDTLAQRQRLESVGQLTGGIAHDFNNLLMVILGNLDIAERRLESGATDKLKQPLANAVHGAKRAKTLTLRLLAFARKQPLKPEIVDINRFLNTLPDFLRRSLGETIDVEVVGGGGVWPTEVDPIELEATILNLAVNARDAMPGGGKLTIEAGNVYLDHNYATAGDVTPGQYVQLSISDTGGGMSRETVERAFEPFFTTKMPGAGTGLGLSQVYGFVKQSDGHAKIYSELGHGTTVKLYLPRYAGEMPVREEKHEADVRGGSKTILVVEDEQEVRAYVVEVLRELNYRVLDAGDAETAANILAGSEQIDLLLTDVVLPDRNGRQLADSAKVLRPELKVLFMTGYSHNAIIHHGRLDPGVELLQKPVTQAELAARVRDLLDGRSGRPRASDNSV